MKKTNLLISVIIPVYNQESFIKQSVDSVLMQKNVRIECIVIDGGSTDNTVEILKKYGNKIKWLSEKDNGISNATNKGLRMATGDIITFIGSDDCYFDNDVLSKVAAIFKDKNINCVNGSYQIIDNKGKSIQSFVIWYKYFLRNLPFQRTILGITNFIIQPSTFWRKELMKKVGYLDEKLKYCMDYDYWLRIIKYTNIHIFNEKIVNYRIHPGSNRGSAYKKLFIEDLEVAKKYYKNILLIKLHKIHNYLTILIYDKI